MTAHLFDAKSHPVLIHLVGAREEGWARRRKARVLLGVELRADLALWCPVGKGRLWLRLLLRQI